MSSVTRTLSYALAINEALTQAMGFDRDVFLIGQGVTSPWYVGKTANGLLERFGPERVIDTPVSENAMTGAAVGAAIAGLRPIIVYPRMDFMLYAFDPIINQAANWHYMSGGNMSVPAVFWGIINRGEEQAAQHSQSLQALFAHIPGLKVVMPSTPYDAKGLMIAAIKDPDPVVYIDDRWLYGEEGPVPERMYSVPIGKAIVRRPGKAVTLAGVSWMAAESLKAARILQNEGIEAEVIDLRSVKPLDRKTLFESVRKTGRLVVADGGWQTCGLASEISALVSENMFQYLKGPVVRVALPDMPAPASRALESHYYPTSREIVRAAKKLVRAGRSE